MEIALLLLVLILALGPGRAAAMAGKLFGIARKVDETKRNLLDPTSLLRRVATGEKGERKEEAAKSEGRNHGSRS
ncbi:hypothetical protein EDC39_11552 [Geothermobacter ehrlichii]|uniref:Sec-independent protein translocase protein TatA n=1 Tax=Geothermobacter ehrlichii TaxID=213224 RepID=A0A5D3WHS1_9BACT|nr:hypothetical protein [Geothermobacter ehrlichii]TYO96106.1 hypothetical protein EDC39_11552 [Geothermobacter ehrlichii]